MQNAAPANGEAMPATRPEAYYRAWKKARELGKELSGLLEDLGDCEFAYIRPSRFQLAVVFGNHAHDGTDPLLAAINDYREGCAAYRELPDDSPDSDDAAAAATYGPALETLVNWTQQARSREAVVNALELIKCERLVMDGMATALIDACIPFIKGEMI
ncbi:hypothetical protein ACU4I5_18735 [Ensifer adhaerens]